MLMNCSKLESIFLRERDDGIEDGDHSEDFENEETDSEDTEDGDDYDIGDDEAYRPGPDLFDQHDDEDDVEMATVMNRKQVGASSKKKQAAASSKMKQTTDSSKAFSFCKARGGLYVNALYMEGGLKGGGLTAVVGRPVGLLNGGGSMSGNPVLSQKSEN
ncbi:uncharacterized protein G2W53_000712 [Senna tora]|uniref:Uncharacterized protein n=1 Tax=Senna tora TaxID=362788 RepID=A0A834XEV4_9FABA|nr:uncharacterized protein G2W53_000712 [Senna tora]